MIDFKKYLKYCPDTGSLTWRISPGGRVQEGEPAGAIERGARMYVKVKGEAYPANKIAVYMKTGYWPQKPVRLHNKNPVDLRWENLIYTK